MMVGETEVMTTTPGRSTRYVLGRVGARAAAGIWRNRVGTLFALVLMVAVGSYAALTWSGAIASPVASQSASTDCADTAMAAITNKSTAAAQRAYQCMDPSFQQRVPEAQFVSQMMAQQTPSTAKLARVGEYQNSTNGSTLVYFALDGGNQSVGYIVYLNNNGKVLRIE
jgi:hypothetical protein